MADYSVNIKANLQGFEKLDEWDAKIKAMSQGVDIPLNLGGSGKNSVKTQAANIGRTINTGVSNALKGSNINPTIQKYATEIKKQFDNDKQLSSVLQSAFDLDESEANKMVSKLRSEANKIDSEAQKAFNKQQANAKKSLNEQAKSIEKINKLKSDALKYDAVGKTSEANNARRKIAQEQALIKERNKSIQKARNNGLISDGDIKSILSSAGRKGYLNYKNTKDLVADKEKYQKIANTFSDLQKKAENKNAKHNAWVQFGKDNIAKWKPMQEQVRKENDTLFKQQQANAEQLVNDQITGYKKVQYYRQKQLRAEDQGQTDRAAYYTRQREQEIGYLKDRNKEIQKAVKSGYLDGNDVKTRTSSVGRQVADNINDTRSGIEQKRLNNLQRQTDNVISKFNNDYYEQQADNVNSLIGKYNSRAGEYYNNLTASAEKINSTYDQLREKVERFNSGEDRSKQSMGEIVQLSSQLKDDYISASNNAKILNNHNQQLASGRSIGSLENKMRSYLAENTKMDKYNRATLQSMINEVTNSPGMTKGRKYDLEDAFSNFKSDMSKEGQTGRSRINELGRGFKQIAQFAGTYGLLQNAQDVLVQMASNVRDVDSAMIELKKVSTASDNDIEAYYSNATKSAKKYGSTIDDVISSTADWSRLGYDLEASQKLSDATTLLQKVGDNMTQETASKGLISTLQGFRMSTDEVGKIIDSVNEVANTQPIDTLGIFEGLERSASSLSASGNTLDQSIAMISAANSVVQDPASIGTAFKTMSMRIRGASTELQEAGLDTEGMAESTAKLREEMLALSGVDIMQDENTFKSTYKIMDELADKWAGLTDIQQASVTELVAGRDYQYVQKCA